MKESDADDFRAAMRKEWEDQRRNGNCEIIKRSEVPIGATILPSVWQMRRKREVSTGKIKKIQGKVEPRRVKNEKRRRLSTYLCTRS